jgi:hypothetical protein
MVKEDEMDKQVFISALTGYRNSKLKSFLANMINQAQNIQAYNGKIELYTQVSYESKNEAFALATWDQNEFCSALITHDLHSFSCKNLGSMIQKLRTE